MATPGPLATAARRAVTIPFFLTLALFSVLLAPVWVPLLLVVDLTRSGKKAATRCGAFFALYLQCEAAGLLASFAIWVFSGAWAGVGRERFLRWNFALEALWCGALYHGAARIFGFRTEVENAEVVERHPFYLFLRHASIADTLLAGVLVCIPHGARFRFVLKRELLWDPCFDVVGNRLPNYFVDRNAEDSAAETAAVGRLAEGLADDEGLLIYPEGTRFTPEKQARVIERLRERGEGDLLARAESLRHVLPPRLGGPLALLERNPGRDVVFCAHTGFEGAGTFSDLWHGSLIGQVIRVSFWRVPFEEIPESHDARAEWLFEHWQRIDLWIAAHRKDGTPATLR